MRHIISALLENEAGALSRVVGLFSARGGTVGFRISLLLYFHPAPNPWRGVVEPA